MARFNITEWKQKHLREQTETCYGCQYQVGGAVIVTASPNDLSSGWSNDQCGYQNSPPWTVYYTSMATLTVASGSCVGDSGFDQPIDVEPLANSEWDPTLSGCGNFNLLPPNIQTTACGAFNNLGDTNNPSLTMWVQDGQCCAAANPTGSADTGSATPVSWNGGSGTGSADTGSNIIQVDPEPYSTGSADTGSADTGSSKSAPSLSTMGSEKPKPKDDKKSRSKEKDDKEKMRETKGPRMRKVLKMIREELENEFNKNTKTPIKEEKEDQPTTPLNRSITESKKLRNEINKEIFRKK